MVTEVLMDQKLLITKTCIPTQLIVIKLFKNLPSQEFRCHHFQPTP